MVFRLHIHRFPVAVQNVGDSLERVEADTDGQRDLRHGNGRARNGVQVFYNERAVLKDEQKQNIYKNTAANG